VWDALGAGIASLLCYLFTLAPDLTWAHWGADGGDFVAAAVTGRVPHPPGFPVYMAFADVFVRLPWRSPAWRLNLLSAVMASATVMLLAYTAQRRGAPRWSALAASCSLTVAPLFWSQALITEVYTTAAFFVALTLLLWTEMVACPHPSPLNPTPADCSSLRHVPPLREGARFSLSLWERARVREWLVAGVVWGLGIAVHTTLVFLAPLFLASLFTARRSSGQRWWRLCLALAMGALLGLTPYMLLPLRGSWPQPWGDLRSLGGWWHMVSGRLYWGFAFGVPWLRWPRRLLFWAALMARQFTPLGALVVLLGVYIRQHTRANHAESGYIKAKLAEVLSMVTVFALVGLYTVGYNTPDSLVYMVAFLPLAALWLAEGLAWLAERSVPAWAGMALPLMLALLNWQAMDVHTNWDAVIWMRRVLAQTPQEAVLVTAQDHHTFALWYAQEGLDLRQDVCVVDRDLWASSSYRQFLFPHSPSQGRGEEDIEDLAAGLEQSADKTVDGLPSERRRPYCQVYEKEVRCGRPAAGE